MNRDASTAPLAALAYVLVGSLAGLGLARLFEPPAASPAPRGLTGFEDAENAARLEAILDELRTLSSRLDASAPPLPSSTALPQASPAERRTPLDPGAPSPDELTELLARTATLVESLERRTAVARIRELQLDPPGSTRERLASFDRTGEASRAFLSSHVLWTYQQVLDRYGKPDQVASHEGSVSWYYEVDHVGGRPVQVTFVFADGLVTGVYD